MVEVGLLTLDHQQDLLRVPPGAVENASSLLTYDSWFLVNNFLYQPKHDHTFQPLFPEETTPDPTQATEAAELCGDNHFCRFDVMATGSLSVGNATRMAHQWYQHRVQSLKPGEGGWGTQARGWAPDAGTRPPRLPGGRAASGFNLWSVSGPLPQ